MHTVDMDGNRQPDMMTMPLTHALTEYGDHICSTCYQYECCVGWQRACGEPVDPCPPGHCGHRPQLVGPFTTEG